MRRRAIDVLLALGVIVGLVSLLHSAGFWEAWPRARTSEEPAPASSAAAADAAGVGSFAEEVAWIFPARATPDWSELDTGPTPARAPADRERGRALFARLCSPCHGDGGKGDGPLATELPRPPRDLVRSQIRSRRTHGALAAEDLFRTITAGAPEYGMPAFAHLSAEDRWALVGRVDELRRGRVAWGRRTPEELPPRPSSIDPAEGERIYLRTCAPCHGDEGDGRGVLAIGMPVDEGGDPAPPTAFARGPAAFRTGATEAAIARVVLLGRAGTGMVRMALDARDLWSVASHVAHLAREGLATRKRRWSTFFAERRLASRFEQGEAQSPIDRWDSSSRTEAPRSGCLACHEGVAPIATGRMALAIDAVAGGHADTACTICHEGRVEAREKSAAHDGLIGNPGSLWVTSLGLGCGKCHSDRGALTSLQGVRFPEPAGGRWLAVVSRRTDPTGACGSNHAYRIQRALMAQETGKVYLDTMSAGLVERGAPRYTDFAVDDPDGAVPAAGSRGYKEFIARALATGHVIRLDRGEGLPTFEEASRLSGDRAVAGYVDYFRKECARCHLWGEGKDARGERRSSGCSACHVLNDDDATTDGADPTIPREKPNHPLRHELVLAIPEQQCNHCHTRGFFTKHTEPHDRAGLGCGDCHTSVDVHGDGNIYPSIRHQLEIRCEDCHGSRSHAPWELPLGAGTKAASAAARGVHSVGGVEHLVTDRGNVRANWLREDGRVVVVSLATGRRHAAPLLRDRLGVAPLESSAPGASRAHAQPRHDALACSACHSGEGQRCNVCHLSYSRADKAQDYILSASNYDPRTTRQRVVLTPGVGFSRNPMSGFRGEPSMFWGDPEMRPDERGRKRPQVAGCNVRFAFIGEEGERLELRPRMNPRSEGYPPPVAPTLSHERNLKARACEECHREGRTSLPGEEDR